MFICEHWIKSSKVFDTGNECECVVLDDILNTHNMSVMFFVCFLAT